MSNHKSIIPISTADGSTSFFNENYGEAYHSKHGAYSEALLKHVTACNIPELAKNNKELCVLDLCFGLGYNSAVAINEALKADKNCFLNIFGLESEIEAIQKIKELEVPSEIESVMKKFGTLSETEADTSFIFPVFSMRESVPFSTGGFELELVLGDALLTIDMFDDEIFDAIFFDPFSPKTCPDLWEAEFIKNVVTKAKPGAYISTYSCARVVKDNFAAAGCDIFQGPPVGRRDGGVLARKR